MPRKVRKEAQAVKRILDKKTGQVVGWLYQWNTGHLARLWKDGQKENVVYD